MTDLRGYKFRMSTDNFVSTSTITSSVATVENETMGLRNFKVSNTGLVVRTMGKTQTFTFTFESLKSVDIVHLIGVGMLLGATIRIELYLLTTKVYDSGDIDFVSPIPLGDYGNYFGLLPLGGFNNGDANSLVSCNHTLPSSVAANSCKIYITSPNGSYIDISKIFISALYVPMSTNISYGMSISYKNTNVLNRTSGGGASTAKRYTVRVINVTFENMSEDDRASMARHFKTLTGEPLYISCFPEGGGSIASEYSGIYVISNNELSISHPAYGRFHTGSVSFEEL